MHSHIQRSHGRVHNQGCEIRIYPQIHTMYLYVLYTLLNVKNMTPLRMITLLLQSRHSPGQQLPPGSSAPPPSPSPPHLTLSQIPYLLSRCQAAADLPFSWTAATTWLLSTSTISLTPPPHTFSNSLPADQLPDCCGLAILLDSSYHLVPVFFLVAESAPKY
jgi:hypothetical protein